MLIDCNFNENIKKMNVFFVKKYNFISIESPKSPKNPDLEYELHLINTEININIDIIKYFNDNDIELTIRGNSAYLDKFSLYIEYFLNKQKLIDYNMNDFIEKTDKEVLDYEK